MVKTIYGDVVLNFGKYRGKEVAEVLISDPGYFFWCKEAGVAKLAPDVDDYVSTWAKQNPALAIKAGKSAAATRHAKAAEKAAENEYQAQAVPPVEFQPSGKSLNENWGAW